MGDIFSVDEDAAGIQRDAAADNIQKGGLARTIAADHRDKFSLFNLHRKIMEHTHLMNGSGIIVFPDILKLKHEQSPSFPSDCSLPG